MFTNNLDILILYAGFNFIFTRFPTFGENPDTNRIDPYPGRFLNPTLGPFPERIADLLSIEF